MLSHGRLLTPLIIFLLSQAGSAQEQKSSVDLPAALGHQRLAREYVERKNWAKALEEAKAATQKAPREKTNRDAWLLLAATEERLGHLPESQDAYEKYLALSPAGAKKQAVTARFEDVKVRSDKYLSYKWGSKSSGLIIGMSPTFSSQMQEEVESEMKSAMDFGFRFGAMAIGYKRGTGKAGAFKAPTNTTATSGYTLVPAGSNHVVEELYFQYDFFLTDQNETKGAVWGIPLYMAGVSNGVRDSDGKLYSAYGYDFATGVSVNFYTKSTFSFDVSAMYHLGMPFTEVKNANDARPAQTKDGEPIKGSTSGVEVRVGLKILFGATPPEEN